MCTNVGRVVCVMIVKFREMRSLCGVLCDNLGEALANTFENLFPGLNNLPGDAVGEVRVNLEGGKGQFRVSEMR